MAVYYIQSRKTGKKRWETHIPGYHANEFISDPKERAEKRIEDWKFHGTDQKDREYRVVEGGK